MNFDQSSESPRPYFVPAGVNFDDLPQELRAAIDAIVNPAYRAFVLEARNQLERSTGMSIVHMMWLEILDQLELARDGPQPGSSEERSKLIDRHIRLVSTKARACAQLQRMREFVTKWGGDLAPLGPCDPPSAPPAEGQPEAKNFGKSPAC